MTTQAADTAVRSSIVVEAPLERAFAVFTDDIGSWWPPEHHILESELAEMVFEPREGGHLYDRGVDGSECRWARVLAYERPERVVISWDINLQWQRSRVTRRRRARWRCVSSPRLRTGRVSSSSTATSTATARAGRACATQSAHQVDGTRACGPSPRG
jgi:uncharacterized protein YndB with AHSA1/START domain